MYVQCKQDKTRVGCIHLSKLGSGLEDGAIIYNNKYMELELFWGTSKCRIWLKYEKSGRLGNIRLILIVSSIATLVH